MDAMNPPNLHHISCPDASGAHRMAYWQWGNPNSSHVVLCVHGLSRQGRDFNVLAQALCGGAAHVPGGIRVVCPDVVGRGHSNWMADPAAYQLPTYAADMLVLLAHLHAQAPIDALDWVGTSMGGLIGLAVCSQSAVLPGLAVRKLVLNDVGPAIEWQALVRIGSYLGEVMDFDNLQAAADGLWAISTGFGPHTPEQWLALTKPMVRPVPGSPDAVRLHYDPAIAVPFRQATQASTLQGEAILWQLYDQIKAPTLLLRGEKSDLLKPQTAQAMTERGARARLVEFAGVGHAPTLVSADQVAAVTGFLLS